MKQFYYQGKTKPPQVLVMSKNLIIIRTKNGITPEQVFLKAEIENYKTLLEERDYYPEASVWVFEVISNDPDTERSQIKEKVRLAASDDIDFIGSLMKRSDNDVYQIYTGNLFLKFHDFVTNSQKEKLFVEHGLLVKMQMGFNSNAYFLQPVDDDKSKEIFEKCIEILNSNLVQLCHPELVVKRKSFSREQEAKEDIVDQNWAAEMIDLEKAWTVTKGANVKICIIDDGIDPSHRAFKSSGKIVDARDMFDESSSKGAHKFDTEIHGTACASIACSNDKRAWGVAPEAQLIIVRSKGLGSVYESEAIYWAAEKGADIISCSWGPPDGSLFTEDDDLRPLHPIPDHTRMALEYAATKGRDGKGCLIFFAAGNGSEPIHLDGYASSPHVMAIGAVNKKYQPSQYSDYGYPLFCCFPSSEILIDEKNEIVTTTYGLTTADRVGDLGYSHSDYFYSFGGTSAACPGVAGVAALMLSIIPDLQLVEAKQLLRDSCVLPVNSNDKYNEHCGSGIINAALVVEKSIHKKLLTTNNMKLKGKIYALHIGIDRIDQKVYSEAYGDLNGCVNDAKDYMALTEKLTSNVDSLFNEQATRNAFESKLKGLAKNAKSGDTVIITYAGHGGVVRDTNGDEGDGQDETLVLYDGPWIDDESYEIWKDFKKGVDIIWISDSCHSGSNARSKIQGSSKGVIEIEDNDITDVVRMRGLRSVWLQDAFEEKKEEILQKLSSLETRGQSLDQIKIEASIITFAACQDIEVAWEEGGQGMFTSKFKEAWNEGDDQSYEELFERIVSKMPSYQNPAQKSYGAGEMLLKKKIWKSAQDVGGDDTTDNGTDKDPCAPETIDTNLYALDDLLISTNEKRILLKGKNGNRSKSKQRSKNVSGGSIRSTNASGKAWDRAYHMARGISNLNDEDYVEPDSISMINADPYERERLRGGGEFLDTYPNPEELNLTKPFIWHLGEEFSQLSGAMKEVCPEIGSDSPKPATEYPLIAHIDTGVLPTHPSMPLHWDRTLSQDFRNPNDKDYWYKKNGLMEQQGHGQATMAILAGNIIDPSESDKKFGGYFGAFPYARVMSLRIADSVVILRAKKFAEAVDYAIKVGADVITMSMAGAPSKRMVEAVNRAYEAGIVVVSAGGNSWSKGEKSLLPDTLMYPARFKRVIAATGATAEHKPYLIKYNGLSRAAGGRFMQTCYGPTRAMKYAMAAYTPNLAWGDTLKNGVFFGRKGGGTSSATPQIAAAAALWIHKYKTQINALIKSEKDLWKKAELTRQALFQSAYIEPNSGFEKYFGNGILKAKEALKITPSELISGNRLIQVNKDSIGRSGLDDLVKMWFRGARGGSNLDSYENRLSEMMAIEIEQLILSNESLADFAYDKGISEGLSRELIKLDQTSDFLKNILSNGLRNRRSRGKGRGKKKFLEGVSSLDIDGGNYRIISENIPYRFKKMKTLKRARDKEVHARFNIVLDTDNVRSNAASDLKLVIPYEKRDAILIQKEFVNEDPISYWEIPAWDEELGRESRNSGSSYLRDGELTIQLNTTSSDRGRGIGMGLKKIKVELFRTAQDKPVSGMEGLIYSDNYGVDWKELDDDMVAKIGKSKRHLLLLHGTFSGTKSSFGDLSKKTFFKKYVDDNFDGYMLGFEMSTIRSGIEKNARDLIKEIKRNKLKEDKFSVIGFSRGCLVARKAFPTSNRIALVGGTNLGTPLVTKKHIVGLLNRVTRLLGSNHDSVIIAARLATQLAHGIWNNPGILDQAENSETLKLINSKIPLSKNHLLVATDYEPCRWWKWALDSANDYAIFNNKSNDMIVPNSSAIPIDNTKAKKYKVECNEIDHFHYFNDDLTVKEIMQFLG